MRPSDKYPGGYVLESHFELSTAMRAHRESLEFIYKETDDLYLLLSTYVEIVEVAVDLTVNESPDLSCEVQSDYVEQLKISLIVAANNSTDPLFASSVTSMLESFNRFCN